jgi:protein-disulfide isomerase/uncharacterized membrane protein
MALPDVPALVRRLAAYRPRLDRAVFGIALLGALVVVHLSIQQERGFDRGCFGFAAPAHVEATFDCEAVVSSGAGTFLGVSNIAWGLGFYGVVAVLSFVALALRPRLRLRAKQARAAVIGIGALYSAYLVYHQVAVLDALCALCLTSATLAATLFFTEAGGLLYSHRTPSAAMSARSVKREFALFSYLMALAVVLAGADVTYFNRLDAPERMSSVSGELVSSASSTVPRDTVRVSANCYYDPEKAPVPEGVSLVNMQDPIRGNPRADVTVIEYFDPNCPACRAFNPIMKQAIDRYGDQATFVYKPVPLWQFSVNQIEALYAAAAENKFFEMLEAQFARQQRGGLSLRDLRTIAEDIGMNPDVLMTRIQNGTYRDQVLQDRQRAIDVGWSAAPTVIVNGRFVDNESRSVDCLGQFIEAAAQETATAQGE